MIRLVIILLTLGGPLVAQQQVNIRSGEHEGFSRLVLTLDPGVNWEIDRQPGLITLRFPDQELEFITNRIFDRISNQRIIAAVGRMDDDESRLELALPCDCRVSSFDFKDAYIVIDIADGPPLPEDFVRQRPPAGTIIADSRWQPAALALSQGDNRSSDPIFGVVTQAPTQPTLVPDPPPVQEEANTPQSPTTMPPPPPPDDVITPPIEGVLPSQDILDIAANTVASEDPEMRERIEQAQQQLLEQLSRAADQGLLDYIKPEIEIPEQEVVKPEPVEMPEAQEVAQADPELLRQLSARTAYDQPSESMLTDIVNEFAMPQCLEDAIFAMDDWSDGRGFSEQVGLLRSGLMGEFDQPDTGKLVSMVQLYLRFGFAAEAEFLLLENQQELDDQALLLDLARALNGASPVASGPVAKGAGCGGAHEMWYLLDEPNGNPVLDSGSILAAFGSYPIEIRTLIGPQLATAFLNRGQTELAHTVLETVRRADGDITSAIRLAEARVLEENQEHNAAVEIYSEIAGDVDTMAPNAMIELARSLILQNYDIPEELLTDLSTAAFSHKGTALGDELRLWEIRVAARVNGLEPTLAQIKGEIELGKLAEEDLYKIVTEILEYAQAEQEGGAAYARGVLEFEGLLVATPAADLARLQVAGQLVELGLPQPALDFLRPTLARGNQKAREVAARAYLQMYQAEDARAMTEGLDQAVAAEILLEIGLQQHNSKAVAEILPVVMLDDSGFNEAAVRAGEWDQVRGDQTSAVVAAYLSDTPLDSATPTAFPADIPAQVDAFLTDMNAPEQPSLQQARDLLEINRASREYLQELLDADQPPDF